MEVAEVGSEQSKTLPKKKKIRESPQLLFSTIAVYAIRLFRSLSRRPQHLIGLPDTLVAER
jgi:hypothetical protein